MDNYPMTTVDQHYTQQSQRQQQWPPHLLPPSHSHPTQAPFPSPPASDHGQHYPPFYQQQQHQAGQQQGQQQISDGGSGSQSMNHLNRASSSLSLNLSSLTVTSPTNLSPINAPSASSALSPVTPISPSTNPFSHSHHHHNHNIPSQFQFSAPDPSGTVSQQQNSGYDDHGGAPPGSSAGSVSGYDNRRTPGPSRSSSSSTSSTSQLPRKRSFTTGTPSSSTVGSGVGVGVSSTLVEENMYDEQRDEAMDLASGAGGAGYDDLEMRSTYPGSGGAGGGSPIDGSGSTSGGEDVLGTGPGGSGTGGMNMSLGMGAAGVGGSMNILGKPMATNNFVTKLYQMINDPKSAHFIAWTELGTSFVVSNVGEFSRSILGSHFKHNNFSSFVRQLNMYGFHKINRTPRAQRTSTDAQTWEFSHHKFLRGRPDLLDEIKRKALEPDPALKHRVELPGEVAAQLGAMRDENRRMWEQLSNEKRKVEKLVGVVGRLWDVVGKGFPGSVQPFPSDLFDDSPNIYITSPTASNAARFPPPLNMNSQSLHSMQSISSPNSSPTTADFPSHLHQQHHQQHPHQSLSRQHSFQHVSFSRSEGTSSSSTPLPASPGSITMDMFDDGSGEPSPSGRGSTKRQRMDDDHVGINGSSGPGSQDSLSALSSPITGPGSGIGGIAGPGKKLNRARSDSAPLGYGFAGLNSNWQGGVAGRPRSGSGLAGQRGMPNIGNMTRSNGTPLLSISTVPSHPSNR